MAVRRRGAREQWDPPVGKAITPGIRAFRVWMRTQGSTPRHCWRPKEGRPRCYWLRAADERIRGEALGHNLFVPHSRSVRPGRDRPDAAYVWPQSLVLPPEPARVVYLDLNHWIGLAKANTGHVDGARFRPALDAIRNAGPQFVFPLSSIHYMEMAGIRDPRQRRDVAAVMEEISGFACLMNNSIVMRLEIEAIIAAREDRSEDLQPIPLLGRGALQAFGKRGGLQVRRSDGTDATDAARLSWPNGPDAFDAWRDDSERMLDRAVLGGPTDAEAPALVARGWDPTVSRRIATERAQQETELDQRLEADPRWRRGRLRDVVTARYIAFDAMDTLREVAVARELRPEQVFGGNVAEVRQFTDSMPSSDVHISLMTASHRNAQKQWEPNDIFDIDALTVAVAYCDVVATERHATHILRADGIADRLETNVVATLDELTAILTG